MSVICGVRLFLVRVHPVSAVLPYSRGVPVLPRFRAAIERIEDDRRLARILLEADAEPHPDANGRVLRRSADGHNDRRRRGVPIVSRGVSGTAPRTDPLGELLRKEAQEERRRR